MNRVLQTICMTVALVLLSGAPLFAQEAAATPYINLKTSFGLGLIVIGAAFGIAKIGAAAVESMARQPEAAKDISGAMILAAALIEGATFFAILFCFLTT